MISQLTPKQIEEFERLVNNFLRIMPSLGCKNFQDYRKAQKEICQYADELGLSDDEYSYLFNTVYHEWIHSEPTNKKAP